MHEITPRCFIMLDITAAIPGSFAIELRVVPVREIGRTLVLATDCKPTSDIESRLTFLLNRKVRFVIRSRDWIESELDAHYRSCDASTEDVTEDQGNSWYWPSWHYLDGDKLVVKASGWEGTSHWTGAAEFPTDHPDRAFWEWLIAIDYYSQELLDDRDITKIKRIWNRFRQRTNAATNKPMNPSG